MLLIANTVPKHKHTTITLLPLCLILCLCIISALSASESFIPLVPCAAALVLLLAASNIDLYSFPGSLLWWAVVNKFAIVLKLWSISIRVRKNQKQKII